MLVISALIPTENKKNEDVSFFHELLLKYITASIIRHASIQHI